MFWQPPQLFDVAKIGDSVKKTKSKWVYELAASVEKRALKTTGCNDHIIHSCHGNTAEKTLAKVPWHRRCTHEMCASSWIWMESISRMAHCAQRNGGARDLPVKTAMKELLDGMVKCATRLHQTKTWSRVIT